jgi:FAD:protein FMN transferase
MHLVLKYLLLLPLSLLIGCANQPSRSPCLLQGNTMGTTYTVRIADFPEDETKHADLAWAIEEELQRLNRIFSTYDPTSEVSCLNKMEQTSPIPVSSDLMLVLKAAQGLYESTDGLFDPTVAPLVSLWGFGPGPDRSTPPSSQEIEAVLPNVGLDKLQIGPEGSVTKSIPGVQLDLSANAKGFAVDKVFELLISQGYRDVLVEIGGELRVAGHNEEGQPWRVEITSLEGSDGLLQLEEGGVATSGIYRNSYEYHGVRYSHLINLKTGYPIQTLLTSVTVLAPTCLEADGAATAVMILGAVEGYQWVSWQPDLQALLLIEGESGDITRQMTAGFAAHLVQ